MKKANKHASNEKVLEQQNQARIIDAGPNKELMSLVDLIFVKEDERKKINDDIRAKVVEIKEKFGIPASTTRQILKEKRMEREAYSQFAHSCQDMRRMLGMQMDLNLVFDAREQISKQVSESLAKNSKDTALENASKIASIH